MYWLCIYYFQFQVNTWLQWIAEPDSEEEEEEEEDEDEKLLDL